MMIRSWSSPLESSRMIGLFGTHSMMLVTFCIILAGIAKVASQVDTRSSLTGAVQYTVTGPGAQQAWLLAPISPSASRVQIIFQSISIQQAELQIYETSSQAAIFSCASCGVLIPPPFYSSSGSVTISIRGVTGVGFTISQFSLQYVALPTLPTTQLNNTYVTLNMGAVSIRPYTINGVLAANFRQQWAIQQSNQIIFSFSRLDLGANCSAKLQIFDRINPATRVLLFEGCRPADMPTMWIYASSNTALVVLTTGASPATLDFQLNYFVDAELYQCGSFSQPALLSDASAIFADGSKSTSLMKRGIDCSWVISTYKAVPVSLVMNRVGLKYGSSVAVYDGTNSRGTVLWTATGATVIVPPVITSTSNSLYIQYKSDSSQSVRYYGFEGDYSSNFAGSPGSGKGYTQLKMSSALDITPPGDGVTHSAGVSYLWYVAPSGATGQITFCVSLLRLLQPGDRLTFLEGVSGDTGGDYGGPVQNRTIGARTVLATFSGSNLPLEWVRTAGSSATIVFESPSPTTTMGETFKLSYYSDGSNFHCGFTTNPALLTMPSFLLSDGSSSVESVYASQTCTWQIQPVNASKVMLLFSRFHLFGGSLQIYKSTLAQKNLYIEVGSTSAVPAPMLVPQAGISLVYTTQSAAAGYGFALTYYGVASSNSFPGDRLVTLTCSSVVSLTLPLDSADTLGPGTDLSWLVAPVQSNGRIYFALSSLRLSPNCSRSYLDIFDGPSLSSTLLGRFCGSTLSAAYTWLQTSAQTALLHFVSDSSSNNTGNFDLAYFSDGPNFHCGFDLNPARMTAPSMTFSDGSGTTNSIYSSQSCEWIIEPNTLSGPQGGDSETLIVLEFLQCDMGGAKIELFDGPSTAAALLWSCDSCSSIPAPIISSSNAVYVRFTSQTSAQFGSGFQLVYWTTTATALGRTTLGVSAQLLQLPSDAVLSAVADNTSAAFQLAVSTDSSALTFAPFHNAVAGSSVDISADSYDGRVAPTVFSSIAEKQSVCGSILNSGVNRLSTGTVTYAATQRLEKFLQTSSEYKSTEQVTPIARDESLPYAAQRDASLFLAPSVCKYRLNSETSQAVTIQIENFSPRQNGRLQIFGGLTDSDVLIFDSNTPMMFFPRKGANRFVARVVDGVLRQSANITAPCGLATIVLQVNETTTVSTASGNDTGVSVPLVDYSLHLIYRTIAADSGQICAAYYKSLQPKPDDADPNVPVYIGLGAAAGFVLMCATIYYSCKLKATQGYVLYPDTIGRPKYVRKIVRATPSYPKYSQRWDAYMNSFLRKGECVVCKTASIVVLRLKCGHGICLEDIKGYLESALGDVSMFPVKCPMHYQGCEGMLDSRIAKRVLTEPQYMRFNEFSDRAMYGDGMRCVHCANYVNFPEQMEHVARVICPYCQQNFCIRCKKAWHHNNRCAVDTYDESLEVWKSASGAQKCPACKKLIEKDDPDTCNHMIHKITDGIPCIRDRTDFCYCCGEEVTGDYPHNEVRHKNVNHFPDGVFQRCRTIVAREKDAERERLKKLRRMKTKIQPFNPNKTGAVAPGLSTAEGSPFSSPVLSRNTTITAPSNGNTNLEAMWLLEQNYDIEASPFGSPARAGPRTGQATVPSTPITPGQAARIHPGGEAPDLWDESLAAASTRSRPVPHTGSIGGSSSRNNRVVPASSATAAAIASGATGIAARPFPALEQQMMYQNHIMASSHSSRGSGTSVRNSASAPQLLIGTPQASRRSRSNTPQSPGTPSTPV